MHTGRTTSRGFVMATARRLRTGAAAARGATQVVSGKQATTVTAKDRDGPYHNTEQEETILERTFGPGEEPAFVKFSAGLTLSLGPQFEFLRIDSSVTLPCLPSEIDEAHRIASDFVADKLGEEEANWLGQPKNSKRGR